LSKNILTDLTAGWQTELLFIANKINNVTFYVMPTCLASFFTIPDKQEGFPTSGNDSTKWLMPTYFYLMRLY